jgi:3-isopropylmalate/(R)-2-methylmalate dehydratase small subunit
MTDLRFKGQAWAFGNDVDTDQIVPGPYLNATIQEQSKHVFENIAPEFCKEFRQGGIIVAGSNFGCGSSRESAPEVLKHLGVAAVVAESFARIFFRNAIAIGLPVLVCPKVTRGIRKGDPVEVDLDNARVTNAAAGEEFEAVPLHEIMLASLRKGGILKLLSDQ